MHFSRRRFSVLALLATCALTLGPLPLRAAEPEAAAPEAAKFRYPEGKHGAGELKYHNGLPVLVVSGTPEEIGEEIGVLGMKPAMKLVKYPHDFLNKVGMGIAWQGILSIGKSMLNNFPANCRAEMEAGAKASGADRDDLIAGNTMFDIKKVFFCSTLLIEAKRSKTGGVLMGRNLDFPTLGYLQDYSLVTVYRQPDKHALATIGFPGHLGCLSGINDAGLAVSVLEVYTSNDDAVRFDAGGVPYALCFRRLLEECSTVEEAGKLLKEMKRTAYVNLAVADRNGGGVFEITPKTVEFRGPTEGVCACTNHFRTEKLGTTKICRRFTELSKVRDLALVDVEDVHARLHAANQGWLTLQTMVFEPNTLKLHLAIGKCPSSALPLKTLELKPLFEGKE